MCNWCCEEMEKLYKEGFAWWDHDAEKYKMSVAHPGGLDDVIVDYCPHCGAKLINEDS